VVLALPAFGVSTKDAFGWHDRSRAKRHAPVSSEFVNDLQRPVAGRHPEIARIISALRQAGAMQAAMSGSGSAVFGLFSSRRLAVRAAKRLPPALGRTLVTRTLNRQTYQRLAAT
jgi:4-diphosphocytidyl-2-C-methyl-D-erythritol kinase